jgi:ribose 5-phosphate isomerase B
MILAIGSDECTTLTDSVIQELESSGHTTLKFGALKTSSSPAECRWAKVAQSVAEAVSTGTCEQGILFCWTGTGVAIAANKVPNIRAALCTDGETAKGSRRWNNANILAMSLRLTSPEIAKEIVREWFLTAPDSDIENLRCLDDLMGLEDKYFQQT